MASLPQPLAATVVATMLVSPIGWAEDAPPAPSRSTFRVRLSAKGGGEDVRAALDGARERLEDPRCASIVSEFEATPGRPLDRNLADLGVSAPDYLGLLLFLDGSGDVQCIRQPDVIAWTSPGNRVVRVCVPQFRMRRQADPGLTEAVIIHEALHTLGLRENPPSSAVITNRVFARCGRGPLARPSTAASE